MGDLEDIQNKLLNLNNKLKDCTIVVAPIEGGDIGFAHNTHNDYELMGNRVFKHLEIQFTDTLAQISKNLYQRFSSRPLDMESKDDYWVLGNGLVVAETSLLVYDHSVYDPISPLSVPMFIRVNVANYMSDNAKDWIEIFS
jgi:hypothetical protein